MDADTSSQNGRQELVTRGSCCTVILVYWIGAGSWVGSNPVQKVGIVGSSSKFTIYALADTQLGLVLDLQRAIQSNPERLQSNKITDPGSIPSLGDARSRKVSPAAMLVTACSIDWCRGKRNRGRSRDGMAVRADSAERPRTPPHCSRSMLFGVASPDGFRTPTRVDGTSPGWHPEPHLSVSEV